MKGLFRVVSSTAACFAIVVDARHPYQRDDRRQLGDLSTPALPPIVASVTPTGAVLTYITPSPGATPIAITEQSQLVTSFVPQYTLCEILPSIAPVVTPVPMPKPNSGPYLNQSLAIQARQAPGPANLGTCTTVYSATATPICATTLTDLVRKYIVTDCDQLITFSSAYGYNLALPTPVIASFNISLSYGTAFRPTATVKPGPRIETVTTYFYAPWQELTAATAPTDVNVKVCTGMGDGTAECVRTQEAWSTATLTLTSISTTTVDLSTTIYGTSQIQIETFTADATDYLTTFTLSTTMTLTTITDVETTIRQPVPSPTASISLPAPIPATVTGPTSFTTITVEPVSAPASGPATDSTTTVHITSTTFVTSTVTIFPTETALVPPTLLPVPTL